MPGPIDVSYGATNAGYAPPDPRLEAERRYRMMQAPQDSRFAPEGDMMQRQRMAMDALRKAEMEKWMNAKPMQAQGALEDLQNRR